MAYQDNEGFQTALLSVCRPGSLILTSGGRLARHLKHRYRMTRMASGEQGWASPDILTLNAWIRNAWNMTWPLMRPLSHLSCLALWKKASSRMPPPEPFAPDLKLFQTLDETYTALVRHGLRPEGAPEPAAPIIEWRRQIMQTFEALAAERKGFHPARLPVHLARAIGKGAVHLPETVVLAAFEVPAPIEEALFESLASACTLKRLGLPTGSPEKTKGVIMPSRKQEATWLARQLVMDARSIPLNHIGVVVPDTETYVPYIRQCLYEIMGEPFDQALSAYNISAGTPLAERPLVQAGLLPLRFWVEREPRTLLLCMLLSPYYSRWAKQRDHIARVDCLWRKEGVEAGLKAFLGVLSWKSHELFEILCGTEQGFDKILWALRDKSMRTGSEWADALRSFWEAVGFPVISNEADRGAWRHTRNILQGMREDLKDVSMDLAEFAGLLRHLASEQLVHVSGSEEAGIQMLGLIESRGMSFEKLYVPGLAAGSLPRPVRPLPFLSPSERHRVQGGTAESQFEFAQEAFGHLLACAPDVTLMRPEEEAAEPLAPSPFWAGAVSEEMSQVVDLWNAPDGVWARAAWLQGARNGLENSKTFPPADPPVEGDLVAGAISVSELSTALACPFRFYAESILKVITLDEPVMGISARERGALLHKVLAIFTARCRNNGLMGKRDRHAMLQLLAECVGEIIDPASPAAGRTPIDAAAQHGRITEGRRWLGDKGGAPGLLVQWLDLELERLHEGWQWVCEESSFEDLRFADWTFSVSGRIDRIDSHREKGIRLWDYKSGELPLKRAVVEDLTEPQIPAYMQAVEAEMIAEIKKDIGDGAPLSGGYIALKTASAISHQDLTPKGETWDEILGRWQEAVARIGKILGSGRFAAEPYPASEAARKESACQYCPYRPLCNREENA
ncbi:MAG: PD-(D/E)XK nuclease family protein [Desulfobacterales bacterium]|nr:PD-(D/E)XK nuclease family protein [Desulfobacterales bacterium]